MDLETLNQLEQSLMELRDAVQQNAMYLNSLGSSMRSMGTSVDRNTQSSKKASESAERASEGSSDLVKAYSDSEKQHQERAQRYSNALDNAGGAVKSFSVAILSAENSLSKYSSGVEGLGNATEALTRGTGGFTRGAALGAVAYTKLVKSALSVDDQIINFRDSFVETAGTLPMTTQQIRYLSAQAGFTGDDMAKLSKRTNELGANLLGLGGYAGQGAAKFMDMVANVQGDERKRFLRLGINQETLLDYMGKYVEMQAAQGNAAKNAGKQGKELTQAAEDYALNLSRWSALTGKKADQLQNTGKDALDTVEEKIKEIEENEKIRQLQADMNVAGADKNAIQSQIDQIYKERDLRQSFTIAMANTMGLEAAQEQNKATITGYQSRTTVQQAIEDIKSAYMKSGGKEEDKIKAAQAMLERFKAQVTDPTIANQIQINGEEMLKLLTGYGKDALGFAINQTGNLEDKFRKIKEDQEKTITDDQDKLSKISADIKQFEIETKQKFQNFLQFIDPLTNTFISFTALLGLMTAGGLLGKVFSGGIRGLGGGAAAEEAALTGAAANGEAKLTGKALQDSLKAERRAAAIIETQAKKQLGKEVAEEVTEKGFKKFIPNVLKKSIKALHPANILKSLSKSATKVAEEGVKSLLKPGSLLKIGKSLGKGVAGILGGVALDYGSEYAKSQGYEKTGAALDIASSALTGASIGATIGSIVPGVGTLIGGALGGVLGSAYGLYQNWGTLTKSDKPDTTSSIEALKSILDQIKLLQKYDFDMAKISKNTEALNAFVSSLIIISGNDPNSQGKAESITGAIVEFLNAKIPMESFINFSKLPLDPDKTKRNAMAFVNFTQAMSSYNGVSSGLGNITHVIALALQEQFKVKLPLDDFQKFAGMSIDAKKAERNSKAFINFANAMAEYKGGPGIVDVVTAWAGKKVNELFGQDGPIDAFSKFAKMDFGPRASSNADAFRKYAESIGIIRDSQANQTQSQDSQPGAATPGQTPQQQQSQQPSVATRAYNFVSGLGSSIGELGSNLWNAAFGTGKHEQGVRPDVIGRKQALEKIMGNKLVVSSGVRPGTPNHGNGAAIDLGFNSNPMLAQSEQNRNKLIANAINLGFTGIGAEYHASGGAHIHLDTSHNKLTGWGSDYTGKSLMRDSPWLFSYLNHVGATKAQHGGIFDESFDPQLPKAQKLASLHTDSLLSKLAKTNADQMKSVLDSTVTQDHHDHDSEMTLEMYNMIDSKLNHVLSALENSHSTHNKMLRNMV